MANGEIAGFGWGRERYEISYALLHFGLTGCTSGSPDTRVADEAAIRAADSDWVKAAQAKQVEKWVSFYADDAAVLPPNDKVATSKNDIRKAVDDLLGLPGLSITWSPTKVEVARAGDIAYLYEAYEVSWKDADGKPMVDRGKNVEGMEEAAGRKLEVCG